MNGEYADALTRALALGKERHPRDPPERHGSFARSVARLCVGSLNPSASEAGPSMRERLVIKEGFNGIAIPFESAVELAEEVCYGELTLLHAQQLHKGCFDDDPEDLRLALALLHTEQANSGLRMCECVKK